MSMELSMYMTLFGKHRPEHIMKHRISSGADQKVNNQL